MRHFFNADFLSLLQVSIFDNMYWKDTTRLIAVWIIILFLHVSKVPAFTTACLFFSKSFYILMIAFCAFMQYCLTDLERLFLCTELCPNLFNDILDLKPLAGS